MRRPDSPFARVAREPLAHFALLAAAIFGLHHALSTEAEAAPDTILVSARFTEGLRDRHRRMHGEAPDEATTRGLVRQFVRDEALMREARRLGLDRDDTIVRRRLIQKMELWIEATVDVPEPTDGELRRALADGAARYEEPERFAFEHVFFRRTRPSAEGEARDALALVRAGAEGSFGDPFLLGHRFTPRSRAELASSFGPSFVRGLSSAAIGEWSGPIESSYGWHLVRVTEHAPASLPALDEARDRVRADLLRARREEAVRRRIDALVARYELVETP